MGDERSGGVDITSLAPYNPSVISLLTARPSQLLPCVSSPCYNSRWNQSGRSLNDVDAERIAGALISNRSLRALNIGQNKMGDAGIEHICKSLSNNTTLQTLSVWGNSFGEGGAKSLSNLLKDNKTLLKLDLHSNRITDQGAAHFGEALKTNSTLQLLYINDTHLDEGAAHICRGLEENTSLLTCYVGKNQVGDSAADSIAKSLRKNKTLREFSLGDNQVRLSQDWAYINVQILYLHGNKKLQNVPHKYLYNNLPKIKVHLKQELSSQARCALQMALDEGVKRQDSAARSGVNLAKAMEQLKSIVGEEDPDVQEAMRVFSMLQKEEEARKKCKLALEMDELVDLDAAVEYMQVLNMSDHSCETFELGFNELLQRKNDFRELRIKLANAIQGNFFALLNKPSDALQRLDALVGPLATQAIINTIRIAQNLEAASSKRLERGKEDELPVRNDEDEFEFNPEPGCLEIVQEVCQEFKMMDSILKEHGRWTIDQRERISILVETCGQHFFPNELKIAAGKIALLGPIYRDLRKRHEDLHRFALLNAEEETHYDDVMRSLTEWADAVDRRGNRRQTMTQKRDDVLQLYLHGHGVKDRHTEFCKRVAGACAAQFEASEMKPLYCTMEETYLGVQTEKSGSVIVCGTLIFHSFSQMRNVVSLLEGCDVDVPTPDAADIGEKIKLQQIYNHFQSPCRHRPSCVRLHFCFVGGNTGRSHTCEIVLAHSQLILARNQWVSQKCDTKFRSVLRLLDGSGNRAVVDRIEKEITEHFRNNGNRGAAVKSNGDKCLANKIAALQQEVQSLRKITEKQAVTIKRLKSDSPRDMPLNKVDALPAIKSNKKLKQNKLQGEEKSARSTPYGMALKPPSKRDKREGQNSVRPEKDDLSPLKPVRAPSSKTKTHRRATQRVQL